jgi:hypothetical protein
MRGIMKYKWEKEIGIKIGKKRERKEMSREDVDAR